MKTTIEDFMQDGLLTDLAIPSWFEDMHHTHFMVRGYMIAGLPWAEIGKLIEEIGSTTRPGNGEKFKLFIGISEGFDRQIVIQDPKSREDGGITMGMHFFSKPLPREILLLVITPCLETDDPEAIKRLDRISSIANMVFGNCAVWFKEFELKINYSNGHHAQDHQINYKALKNKPAINPVTWSTSLSIIDGLINHSNLAEKEQIYHALEVYYKAFSADESYQRFILYFAVFEMLIGVSNTQGMTNFLKDQVYKSSDIDIEKYVKGIYTLRRNMVHRAQLPQFNYDVERLMQLIILDIISYKLSYNSYSLLSIHNDVKNYDLGEIGIL